MIMVIVWYDYDVYRIKKILYRRRHKNWYGKDNGKSQSIIDIDSPQNNNNKWQRPNTFPAPIYSVIHINLYIYMNWRRRY